MRKSKLENSELKAYVLGLFQIGQMIEDGKEDSPEIEALRDSLDFGIDMNQDQRDLIGLFFRKYKDRESELRAGWRAELEALPDDMIEHFLRG